MAKTDKKSIYKMSLAISKDMPVHITIPCENKELQYTISLVDDDAHEESVTRITSDGKNQANIEITNVPIDKVVFSTSPMPTDTKYTNGGEVKINFTLIPDEHCSGKYNITVDLFVREEREK